ncbi:MAG: gliding motility-associated ABC transporter permease subunit GldF [Bacteroidales bacterium]|nr:gliding motility-associated ABC transporter permease subunit GldF [Bacteroidales bacterium]
MYALFKKEFLSFFAGITGYVVIIFFLVLNSVLLWIIPGPFNIIEVGYATLDSFFTLAPWIFLFLVPAITMKMFAEEKKTGTLDTILAKPISDLQIVLAKFFTGVLLVIVSLFPTVIYFITLYLISNPVGNIDTGSIFGSYIGLFFLASIYVSIGIFASSLTDNQIIAFLTGAIFCFILFFAFDSLTTLPLLKPFSYFLINLGINEHYKSISKGVLDTRDIVYFLSMISIFIILTKIKLASRKWK